MPEILKQIDKNANNEIVNNELRDFLDGKNKSLLPDEKNLQAIAKEMDDNMNGKKREYYIDENILTQAYTDISKKIKLNQTLTT
jgi:hypothetical protein